MNPCVYTHDQLASGTCPWCDYSIGGSEARKWNLRRLEADFTSNCRQTIFGTLVNVRRFVPDAFAFSVINKALGLADNDIEFVVTSIAIVRGIGLGTDVIVDYGELFLDDHCQVAPAFLFLGGSQLLQFSSAEVRTLRAKIVHKLVDLRPGMQVLGRPESALPIYLYPDGARSVQHTWESKRRKFLHDNSIATNHNQWMQFSGLKE